MGELKDPYRTMVLLAGGTGLRVSEIMGMKWGDVNGQNLEVDVRRSVEAGREGETKTEASESPVPLDPVVATELLPAADRAEIDKVGWHTFRHTCRASLKHCGTPLEVQKDLMRRANVRVTAEV